MPKKYQGIYVNDARKIVVEDLDEQGRGSKGRREDNWTQRKFKPKLGASTVAEPENEVIFAILI